MFTNLLKGGYRQVVLQNDRSYGDDEFFSLEWFRNSLRPEIILKYNGRKITTDPIDSQAFFAAVDELRSQMEADAKKRA